MPEYVLESAADTTRPAGAEPTSIANVEFDPPHPNVPASVPAGEGFSVTVRITNGAGWINPIDPDSCWDLGGGSGYQTTVTASVGGSEVDSEKNCFPAGETWTWTLDIPALDPGEHVIEFAVEGTRSGSTSDTMTHSITAAPPEDDGGNGDNDNDDGGDDPQQGFWANLSPRERLAVTGLGAAGAYVVLNR